MTRAHRGGFALPGWVPRDAPVRTRGAGREEEINRAIGQVASPDLPSTSDLHVAGRRWAARGSTFSADLWVPLAEGSVYRLVVIDLEGHGDIVAYLGAAVGSALSEARRRSPPPPAGAAGALAWAQDVIMNVPPKANGSTGGYVLRACGGAVAVDGEQAELEVAARGMNGFFRSSSGGVDHFVETGSMMAPELVEFDADVDPPVQQAALLPGDRIWIMTDGILEAGQPANQFGSSIDRVLAQAHDTKALDAALELIHDLARDHAGRPGGSLVDDATLVAMAYRPGAGGAGGTGGAAAG